MKMGRYLFVNGRIYTGSDTAPFAEALGVIGRRVFCCTTEEEARALCDSFEVVDLKGKTLVPGFNDSHVHLYRLALQLGRTSLKGCVDLKDVASKVEDVALSSSPGEWISCTDLPARLISNGSAEVAAVMEEVSAYNPVVMCNSTSDLLWANQLALESVEFSALDAQFIKLGAELNSDGKYTGIFRDAAARAVQKIVPELKGNELVKAFENTLSKLNELGIVAVHDMDAAKSFSVLARLKRTGRLTVRAMGSVGQASFRSFAGLGMFSGFGDEWLKVGPLVMCADGDLTSRCAHLLRPYENDPYNCGRVVMAKEGIQEAVTSAVKAGISCSVRAVGDRANRDVLDVFESVFESSRAKNLRHRVECVQLLHPDDLKRFGELDVTASMQPVHITEDMSFAERNLGKRSRWSYPLKSILYKGGRLAFGSDSDFSLMDPLKGMFASVTRKDFDGVPDTGWYCEERISICEAMKAYTSAPAWLAFDEEKRGTLEAGKLADLVILSEDIFDAPSPQLLRTKVEATMVDGKFVYVRKGSEVFR